MDFCEIVYDSALPPSIDLEDVFPVPWAVAYALRSQQEEVKRNWGLHTDEHLFSPGYVYNQRYNPHNDEGMNVWRAMEDTLRARGKHS